MAVEAPRARALTMCPTFLIPPSAITGTPLVLAYWATEYTAEAWALPQAVTSWVVQIEPIPIPTLSPSAPASMSNLA